jgi:recombination protein RecA
MYGQGISREGGVLDIGVDNDIVKKSGAWYTYEGEQLGQGRENAKQFLHDNPEIMIEISARIRTEMGLDITLEDAPDGPDAEVTELDPDDQPISLDD